MAVCKLRGPKGELVEDLCLVQYAVTKSTQTKNQTNKNQKQTNQNQKYQKTTQHKQANQRRDRCQFMSELMEEVISSRHGIAAKTKGKHQNHKAIPEGCEATKSPCGNQGSPQPGSPRSHGASHHGITTHL